MVSLLSGRSKRRYKDFVLLSVFVLVQHGYVDRAHALVEALIACGETSREVLFARTVIAFFSRDFEATLNHLEDLDRIDPIERFGEYALTNRQRMRRYIKARCLFEIGDLVKAKDAVEVYLRHGVTAGDSTEGE